MKTLALFLLLAILQTPLTALAEQIQFEFINNTNESVTGFYLFPEGRDEADNMVADNPLQAGEAADADLGEAVEGCIYTALIDFGNGKSNQQDSLDLCNMQTLYAIASMPQKAPAATFESADSDVGCETTPLAGTCDWNAELNAAGQLFNQKAMSLTPQETNRIIAMLADAYQRGEKSDIAGSCKVLEEINKTLSCR